MREVWQLLHDGGICDAVGTVSGSVKSVWLGNNQTTAVRGDRVGRAVNDMNRKRRFRKLWQMGMLGTIALTTILLFLAYSLGPAYIDKRFNPVGIQYPEPVNADAKALHESLAIADLHADSLLWGRDLTQRADFAHVDLPRLIEGNVALQLFAVVTQVPDPLLLEGNRDDSDSLTKLAILQRWPLRTWSSPLERSLYQAKRLQRFAQKAPDQFRILNTQQDLSEYLAQRQTHPAMSAGILSLEGAQVLEGQLDNLDRLYEAGYRVIGLSHFFDNEVADSAHGIGLGGLSDLGRAVIRRMDERGLIIDLAHASPQTIDEVLALTQRPVLASHTGVQGTCENLRNLSDRQLQSIAQNGGIIGIGFWKTAVCGTDVEAIVRAMRYVADRIGVEHVALGSDFDGAVRVPFDVSHLDQITVGLLADGFTETEIQSIMGMNVVRLLRQHLPT